MRSLIAYTKQHQAKGIQWNPKGVPAPEVLRQIRSSPNGVSTTSPAPSAGGPAPPPPPMPAHLAGGPPLLPSTGQAKAPESDMGSVFKQLNQGSSVTSGLKKVDPSQMTHKNPNLRANIPIPTRSDSQNSGKATTPPGKKPKPENMRVKRPPKMELDGNKWLIVSTPTPTRV
jgi:adenylyl cyclase-associated protein